MVPKPKELCFVPGPQVIRHTNRILKTWERLFCVLEIWHARFVGLTNPRCFFFVWENTTESLIYGFLSLPET